MTSPPAALTPPMASMVGMPTNLHDEGYGKKGTSMGATIRGFNTISTTVVLLCSTFRQKYVLNMTGLLRPKSSECQSAFGDTNTVYTLGDGLGHRVSHSVNSK